MRRLFIFYCIANLTYVITNSILLADESNSLITFQTKGPDTYNDGTIVEDGEKYALVWQESDITNVVFNLDGTIYAPIDKAYFLRAFPHAKDGHCKLTVVSVNKNELPKLNTTGKLCMYLLDTRMFDNDGNISLGDTIHSSKLILNSTITTTDANQIFNERFYNSNINTNVPIPQFIKILVSDKDIYLEVSNVTDKINYVIKDKDDILVSKHPVTGYTNTIYFLIDKNNKQMNFYKITN